MNKKNLFVIISLFVVWVAQAEDVQKLNFIYSDKVKREKFPPKSGEGLANIQLVNKTESYICVGWVGKDGNLHYGWTDGNKGNTSFYVGPGSQTDLKSPYTVYPGDCFVVLTNEGKILGYGSPSKTGDYVLVIKK